MPTRDQWDRLRQLLGEAADAAKARHDDPLARKWIGAVGLAVSTAFGKGSDELAAVRAAPVVARDAMSDPDGMRDPRQVYLECVVQELSNVLENILDQWRERDPRPDAPGHEREGDRMAEHEPDRERRVFVARREEEHVHYQLLKERLEAPELGFTVVDGFQRELDRVSQVVLRRIRSCRFFLAIEAEEFPINRPQGGHTTSSWIVQESGAAIASDCEVLLLVEEGVADDAIGGLQADVQRVPWRKNTFGDAASEAVRMIAERAAKL